MDFLLDEMGDAFGGDTVPSQDLSGLGGGELLLLLEFTKLDDDL